MRSSLDSSNIASSRQVWRGFLGSRAGKLGFLVLAALVLGSLLSLPWTLLSAGVSADGRPMPARYKLDDLSATLRPPVWAVWEAGPSPSGRDRPAPKGLFGTDKFGRDLFVRCLAGGGISIGIGLAAAAISVIIGTLYGCVAGFVGGRIDALMMRIVDVLYGLPYLLLMVLLAVAGDAILQRAALNLTEGQRAAFEIGVLLVAIGGLSWLTMARVVRSQVLSLKSLPFVEAARAIGVPLHRQLFVHLLPNLTGTIVVYATLTVPQAILQESFLSFLGIGVRPPMPSWGNLAADGLLELNPVRVRWWLLLFPCVLLGATLLALNFVGEGLREALDPRRRTR